MRSIPLIAAVIFACLTSHAEESLSDYLFDSGAAVDKREVVRIWTATWCGPCHRLKKEVDAAEKLEFRIEWVDVDQVPMLADVPNGIPHAEWDKRKWYTKPVSLKDLIGKWRATKGKR